jgi:alpha-glucosidase
MRLLFSRLLVCFVLLCSSLLGQTSTTPTAKTILVKSPDGKVQTELSAVDGSLRYRILVDGNQVLAPSDLGIVSDGKPLGRDVELGKPVFKLVNEQYRFFGAHAVAINHANEASIPAISHQESFWIDVHVANDGVGVRLRLAAKQGRRIETDQSSWRFEGNPTVWADKLDASYESHYRTMSLDNLGQEQYGMPLSLRVGGLYVTVSEAALKDYGDLALRRSADGSLQGVLYADPTGWTTDDAVIQPWRVTIIARTLSDLVNTTLVQNLNSPPADPLLASADWIRPGRSSWQWMAIGSPRQDDQKQWVDMTKQLGYEYYLVDEGWEHWTTPWPALAEVVAYAKTQNVKIWLWVHSNEVKDPAARKEYFRKAVAIGVVGIKIDFPPQCNHWWSNWYYDTARDAAAYKLMVDFHGANKPTGMERTWPNVLTREGVRGHEWHMTRYQRILEPAHDTILPFTRYIAGPGDYTPTVFESKELQGISWAHEVAEAISFTSPFLCFGGNPKDFIANPAKDLLMAIPSTWDETRVLRGSDPGKVVAEARRKGDQWFVAVMNGGDTMEMDISLDFLARGDWRSSQLFDVKGHPDAWDRKEIKVTRTNQIHLVLDHRGGFVAWIRK